MDLSYFKQEVKNSTFLTTIPLANYQKVYARHLGHKVVYT